MRAALNQIMGLARIFIILVAIFQVSVMPVSASPIIFSQAHHTGISDVYTYDEIESSFGTKDDRTSGLSRVLSVKGVRSDHEVLTGIGSVAAKGGYTSIYRAVSQAELDDIAQFGLRMKSGGCETGKLFAPTLKEATQFGKYNPLFG